MQELRVVVLFGLSVCPIGIGAQSPSAPAMPTVTFYANGTFVGGLVPGSRSVPFQGCIFDGQQEVGCATWGEFMSVQMTPGVHVFSASLSSKHPAGNSQLTMTLEPAKNYFVRAVEEDHPFRHVVGSSQGRLDVVNCEVAHDETRKFAWIRDGKWKPVPNKNMGPLFKQAALADMPVCPSTP